MDDDDSDMDDTTTNRSRRNRLPWNPSSRIDSNGFLQDTYYRIPGEWEWDADIPGRYGPRSKYFRSYFKSPVSVRQVPGDGNCLFHSIAVALCAVVNNTHIDMRHNKSSQRLKYRSNHRKSKSTRNEKGENRVEESIDQDMDQVAISVESRQEEIDQDISKIDVDDHDDPNQSIYDLKHLYKYSRFLRHQAVDALSSKSRRLLFLQGNEYLRACDLVSAAASQYDITGEEYCSLMRKDSYWGGGPEIVALCNVLRRPIHVYELCSIIPQDVNESESDVHSTEGDDQGATNDVHRKITIGDKKKPISQEHQVMAQFRLRRMACFGSPKFDRQKPIHILSADSRFPDIDPGKQSAAGNHFLVLFPVEDMAAIRDATAQRQRESLRLRSKRKGIRGGANFHRFKLHRLKTSNNLSRNTLFGPAQLINTKLKNIKSWWLVLKAALTYFWD